MIFIVGHQDIFNISETSARKAAWPQMLDDIFIVTVVLNTKKDEEQLDSQSGEYQSYYYKGTKL